MMFLKKVKLQSTIKSLFVISALSLILNACSNDFELTADWKSIPVVYAILSSADTAHYVRVEKAFLDESTSAKTVAQIPDSLYYGANEIQVYIERVSNGQKTLMRRVDGVLEGIPRKEGIFATTPNWLYKVLPSEIGNLQPGEKYRIIVERNDGNPITFGETTISKKATISAPEPNAAKINMWPNSLSSYQWQADTVATLFNVTLQVPIRMLKANGQLVRIDTLYWQAAQNIEKGDNLNGGLYTTATKISGAGFYQFLHDKLEPFAVQDTFRYFGKVRVILDGGGKEITNFQISAAANAGVTGAEIVPVFTNITNGMGVISSKSRTISSEYFVQQPTLDSVRIHPLTSDLNFSL